jgi:hypothetical protein
MYSASASTVSLFIDRSLTISMLHHYVMLWKGDDGWVLGGRCPQVFGAELEHNKEDGYIATS